MKKIKMKKLNRKGFTLIELLAVIVILAILILLAMPRVLDIMENARQSAFKNEANSIIKAAQMQYSQDSMNPSGPSECYDINVLPLDKDFKTNNYTGYVKITDNSGKMEYKITLTNGKYYLSEATTNQVQNASAETLTKTVEITVPSECKTTSS